MRKILLAAALASSVAACKSGPGAKPTAKHDLPGTDVQNCWTRARNIDTTLGSNPEKPIRMTVYMYVDKDGAVPAAFIHDAQNNTSPILAACILDSVVESKFDSENTDWVRPQPMFFSGPKGQLRQLSEQPQGQLDEKLAQSTLRFTDWATPADKGWGYYLTHDYARAIEQFRAAKSDPVALRGLALALADSGGDLKEARAAGEAALKAEPGSVGAHVALVDVCLKQKDDRCALDNWEGATRGELDQKGNVVKPVDEKQKVALSSMMAPMVDQVREAHSRESANAEKEQAQQQEKRKSQASAADPSGCASMPAGDEQDVCFAKYCYGKGAQSYAKELKDMTGANYTAGAWRTGKSKSGASEVTVQIRAKKGTPPHDATWEMQLGESVQMKARNVDASNIAQRYSACKK